MVVMCLGWYPNVSPKPIRNNYEKQDLMYHIKRTKLLGLWVTLYQPSPQPSSSSVSFGFISSFFAATGLAAGLATGFFAAEDLDRPFGSGLAVPDFFCDCAANHPAKSGSPSSNGVADAVAVDCFEDSSGVSKLSKSSFMSPQESPTSSSSVGKKESATTLAVCDELRDRGAGGDLTACR